MQAIRTRIVGARGSHGAKVNARCQAGTLSVTYDHKLDLDANHKAAAQKLVEKLETSCCGGWAGQWVGGCADGDMYWVCLELRGLTQDVFTVSRDTKIGASSNEI